MKKRLLIITALILILTALTFAGCDNGEGNNPNPDVPPTPTPQEVVKVSAKQESVLIHEKNFADFDFTTLFVITIDDREILIQSTYLDLSHLPQNADEEGYVTCTYGEESATCYVQIKATEYVLDLAKDDITITQIQIDDGFDFLALFSATEDGQKVQIEESMIRNNVKRDVGDYTYTVTYHGITKTLTVHVKEAHRVEIVNSYKEYSLTTSEIETFDFTELFSLYVDGVAVKVEKSMLDLSALSNAEEDKVYDVVLSYRYNENCELETLAAKVRIVAPKSIVLTASDIITYPNGEFIDLTKLFTIKDGDIYVPVTIDMISGDIDYSNEGINNITLTYKGQTATATVEVKRGVVIDLPKGDTIIVRKGTNKNAYNFAGDISVVVNGLRFSFVTYGDGANFHIDTTNVDFDTAGSYDVTVKIPYSGVKGSLQNVEKTLTYVVKENVYELSVLQSEVVLAQGTTAYDCFKNVAAKVNGVRKKLIADKKIAQEDSLTVWAQLVSEPIDFGKTGTQHVKIAVYPEGVNSEPVYVEYDLTVKTGVDIVANNRVVFVGDTVYAADLFTIKDGEKTIKVTADMLEGKVDTFKAGVYTVNIDYLGLQSSAKVIVFSDDIVGTYKTNMTTIPGEIKKDYGDYGDSEDPFYGDGEDYDDEEKPVVPLKDMTFSRDGQIIVNGKSATVSECIDETTIIITVGTDQYTMYINDGIVVIDPDNSLRMSFTDNKRPLVYFSEKEWELRNRIVVNSGMNYVLSTTTAKYSIDTFKVARKGSDEIKWFGLYIGLVSAFNGDCVYDVNWGDASYPDGFVPEPGASSTLTYNGTEYDFAMSTANIAKVEVREPEKKYAGMIFSGTFDGDVKAKLTFDSKEWISLTANGKFVFSNLTAYDVKNMVNGGFDYDNDTVFLYKYEDEYYSYKFKLDVENKTFELIERDNLFGYYEYNDKYIYLDGFGTGFIKMEGASYTKVKLSYTKTANEIAVKFIDAPYTFAYGKEATFYLAAFGNVLTVKQMEGGYFGGVEFVNSHIVTGAIVKLDDTAIDGTGSVERKNRFWSALHIITADGELSDAQKQACTDVSAVDGWTKPGFYQFSVKLELNGEEITSYYAMQILHNKLYSKNSWLAVYPNGVSNNSVSLTIDQYGRVILNSGDKYTGYANLTDNTTFSSNLKNAAGNVVKLEVRRVDDGLISVRATGAILLNEYFSAGAVDVAGGNGAIIRKITYNGATKYMFSTSVIGTMTELVDIQTLSGTDLENGAVITFAHEQKTYIAKIVAWGNAENGLLLSDANRGTYSCEGQSDLVVDGFGGVRFEGKSGTYTENAGGSILVAIGSDMRVFKLDASNHTYKDGVKLDETLVKDKTFSANYSFICPNGGGYLYNANTEFVFGENGKVTVNSKSSEHDEGEDACTSDTYKPPFAGNGTYTVSGNTVTINVSGATFTFKITDVSVVNELVCTSTTLDSKTDQGAFSVGTKFSA